MNIKSLLPLTAIVLLYPVEPRAATITLDSQAQGWYDSSGFNDSANGNYIVGATSFGGPWRNFFVFDSSAIGGATVNSAVLSVFNPIDGFSSNLSSETFSIFLFSGSLADLTAGNGGTTAYDALGSGTFFGSATISSANNNSYVSINLDANFLSFINGTPGTFALGGVLTSLNPAGTDDQYVFAFSDSDPPPPRLTLTTLNVAAGVPDGAPRGLIELLAVGLIFGVEIYRRKLFPAARS